MQTDRSAQVEFDFLQQLLTNLTVTRVSFLEFVERLGRRFVFQGLKGEPLTLDQRTEWIRWVEEVAFPWNTRSAILIEDARAIYPTLPEPFTEFLEYHHSWLSQHSEWKAGNNETYYGHHGQNFPQDLEPWVHTRISRVARQLYQPVISSVAYAAPITKALQ